MVVAVVVTVVGLPIPHPNSRVELLFLFNPFPRADGVVFHTFYTRSIVMGAGQWGLGGVYAQAVRGGFWNQFGIGLLFASRRGETLSEGHHQPDEGEGCQEL